MAERQDQFVGHEGTPASHAQRQATAATVAGQHQTAGSIHTTDSVERQSRPHAEDAKHQAQRAQTDVSNAVGDLKHQAQQASDKVTAAAGQAGAQVRDSAQQAAGWAQRESAAAAARQKDWLGGELSHVGSALRAAADRLHETDDDGVARYAETAADQIESAAHYLRQRDIGGLVDDVESFARRSPELFLGGMFLAGLGISRFLKASRHHGV